jgi:tRNA G18 (ribose-2'-O)-methylase SpoU
MQKKVFLILHDIRSVHNVGAIFRTAECVGVKKLYLTGITPTPKDRFGRDRADIHKSALGAERIVEWEHNENILNIFDELKKNNVDIVAVEQSDKSLDYKKLKIEKPTAFVFGNEIKGIADDILDKTDQIVEIPILGKKESLNVSVATGVLLFRVLGV